MVKIENSVIILIASKGIKKKYLFININLYRKQMNFGNKLSGYYG